MFWLGGIFGIVLLVALGFVILHFAEKESSLNLKIAGYLLLASGLIMAISAAIMMFSGFCRYDRQGHHGYGMHGSHSMMRGGCNHRIEKVNKPKMDKDSTGVK